MKNKKIKKKTVTYPQEVINLINDPELFGRMNDPTSSAYIKGPCGDEMELYLVIEEDKISEIKYFTQGCDATKACAAMTAKLAKGKTINEALSISAGQVIFMLNSLPQDHLHCSILSVSTLYRAIADFLLRR
ncbi:MAG: iron-sulfur cluster assembly scaffold protein [Candidatus Omnitrophota bacterium]